MMHQTRTFTATLSAPGYLDIITVHAMDAAEAQARAEAYAREPYSDTPYMAFRASKGTVTVHSALLPISRAAE